MTRTITLLSLVVIRWVALYLADKHFLLIDATAVTLGQGHGKVTENISPDPYILCAKYLRFSWNSFDVRGKSYCGGGRGEEELKT